MVELMIIILFMTIKIKDSGVCVLGGGGVGEQIRRNNYQPARIGKVVSIRAICLSHNNSEGGGQVRGGNNP